MQYTKEEISKLLLQSQKDLKKLLKELNIKSLKEFFKLKYELEADSCEKVTAVLKQIRTVRKLMKSSFKESL